MSAISAVLRGRFWAGHLLFITALFAVNWLGLWQIDAWQSQRVAAKVDRTDAKTMPLKSLLGPNSAFPSRGVGQPVSFTGTWKDDSTVYIEGRLNKGKKGYWVLSPVVIGSSAIPVVRGWSPRPTSAPVKGQVNVTGWLEPPEGQLDTKDKKPDDKILPQVRIASLVQHIDMDLYGGFVVGRDFAGPGATNALQDLAAVRPPPAESVGWSTGLRNLLYGIQWYIFGVLGIFIWFRWCRDELARVRAVERAAQEPNEEEEKDGNEPSVSTTNT